MTFKTALQMVLALAVTNMAPANPVMPGADPDIAVFGDTYWLYPTTRSKTGKLFKAFSSKDLKTWEDRGVLLDLDKVPWVAADGSNRHSAWAPGILGHNGKYYLYYAVGPQAAGRPSRTGVAVADKPEGPFEDSGKPLLAGGLPKFEAIDPMAFTDPKTGKTFLYAGGSAGATLRVWELNDDLVSLKREVNVETPKEFTEGAFMHVRNGVYYMSYSHGKWSNSTYSVHYSTAPSPTGPWTYKGLILQSDATHQGPGHHAFVQNPSTGDWFIVYHRWETTQTTGKLPGGRQIAIEPIQYGTKGEILPVKMTDGGSLTSPITK